MRLATENSGVLGTLGGVELGRGVGLEIWESDSKTLESDLGICGSVL